MTFVKKTKEWKINKSKEAKGISSCLYILIKEMEEDKLSLNECTYKTERNKFNDLIYKKRENV